MATLPRFSVGLILHNKAAFLGVLGGISGYHQIRLIPPLIYFKLNVFGFFGGIGGMGNIFSPTRKRARAYCALHPKKTPRHGQQGRMTGRQYADKGLFLLAGFLHYFSHYPLFKSLTFCGSLGSSGIVIFNGDLNRDCVVVCVHGEESSITVPLPLCNLAQRSRI